MEDRPSQGHIGDDPRVGLLIFFVHCSLHEILLLLSVVKLDIETKDPVLTIIRIKIFM